MIYSLIDFPTSESRSGEKDEELIAYLRKSALISTTQLKLPNAILLDQSSLDFLNQIIHIGPCNVQGLVLDSDEIAVKLLDNGLHVAFFDTADETELLKKVLKSFPRSRVGVCFPDSALEIDQMISLVDEFTDYCGHLSFKLSEKFDPAYLNAAKHAIRSSGYSVQIYFELPVNIPEDVAVTIATFTDGVKPILSGRMQDFASEPTQVLSNPYAVNPIEKLHSQDIISLFIACLRSDRPDKLYTTVVCDEHGSCLGLVYSNDISLRVAILEQKGVYWSRSRSGLWRKGDTSGMYQELLCVKVDCDFDAIRFSVIQHGDPPAFCHLMTRTCWGHVNGLKKLETILFDRKKSAPPGSYTKRLFDDPDLLRKKLLEEVQVCCCVNMSGIGRTMYDNDVRLKMYDVAIIEETYELVC
jgi:phosphoribosyl-AMP cyclohydrolase